MLRSIIFCLVVSSVWASPSPGKHSKQVFSKIPGPRIINGETASLGQFPWQAAVYVDGGTGSWFCGGSIISPEFILTAGHCVEGGRSAQILTGLINLEGSVGTVSDSSDLILHEGFDGDTLENDLGLVRLSRPLSFDDNTAAINLDSSPLGADQPITVSGWGLTSDDSNTVSPTLNFVKLVTISNDACARIYRYVFDGMVCATSDTSAVKSTCNGDSGGPVVLNPDTNPIQVATVSFVSDQGCETGLPSGYTRTAYYRDWIRDRSGV